MATTYDLKSHLIKLLKETDKYTHDLSDVYKAIERPDIAIPKGMLGKIQVLEFIDAVYRKRKRRRDETEKLVATFLHETKLPLVPPEIISKSPRKRT